METWHGPRTNRSKGPDPEQRPASLERHLYMARRRIIRLVALAATGALLAGGCAGAGVSTVDRLSPPVVVIVLDELPLASLLNRDGRIDEELFPNFARLQKDSTWFRNATTEATFTHEVMPSLLTGARPQDRLQGSPFLPHNLFTLLAGSHELYTTQPFPRFCPEGLCRLTPPAPDQEPLRERWPAFAAGERGQKFLSFASFLEAAERPRLLFGHFVMPHQPWAYLPSGMRYPLADFLPGQVDVPGRGKGWTQHWWLTVQAMQRHLLQTQFTDALIGALLDRMTEAGTFDESLLIVTADHGIAFEPGAPKRIATGTTMGQLAHVPLFVKRPDQDRAKIVDDPVELIDIVPTVADVVGADYTYGEVDGRSLFHRGGGQRPQRRLDGFELSDSGRELYEAIDAKYRMFAHRGDGIDPFRPGSRRVRDDIGRSVTDFARVRSIHLVDIANRGMLAGNTDGTLMPALLQGAVGGPPREGTLLAVAVDGRIAAFTPTYIADGQTHFYCMLPPRFLAAAPHDIRIYEVGPGNELIAMNLAPEPAG